MPSREVIVVRGPSSVGKTAVGKELARRLGFTFIDEDNVRHEFQGDHLSAEAFSFSLKRLKQITKSGQFVVAGYLNNCEGLEQYLFPAKVFRLKADVDTLLERNSKHIPSKRMSKERVRFLCDTIKSFPDEIVVLTDGKSIKEVVQELFSQR